MEEINTIIQTVVEVIDQIDQEVEDLKEIVQVKVTVEWEWTFKVMVLWLNLIM